jgi:DNA-directed RNA polymerase subunit L
MSSFKGKSISRQGLQALYTFTPFKLLRAETGKSYVLILAPITYFNSKLDIEWRSKSCKNVFKVARKKVVHPHMIYPLVFQKDNPEKYIYIRKDIEEENSWKFPPTYIEFSWSSLNSGYYCRLGWTLLASKSRCPQEKYCPNLKGNPCQYYSRNPLPYVSLYNVYPRIQRRFEDPLEEPEPIIAIRYNGKPLTVMRFVEQGAFLAFIDGVIFSPKLAWLYMQPTVLLKEGLGFKINNVHAIELEFLPDALEELIRDILLANNDIVRWLILKYKLYIEKSEDGVIIRERRGFIAFRNLDKIVEQAVQEIRHTESSQIYLKVVRSIQEAKITKGLIDFASILFLHSLAHVLKNILIAKNGCGPSDIDYYIEHPSLRVLALSSEKIRIILFETATGGFGYIKNFVEEIRKSCKTDLLEKMISTAIKDLLEKCERKVDEIMKKFNQELREFQNVHKDLVELITMAYYQSFPNTSVYPHVNSIRRVIAGMIPQLTDEMRALLDDLLAKGPHCWDGCQLCVMMERGCNFLPFDQPFLVSEKLLKAALEKILDSIEKPTVSFPLKRGISEEFEALLSIAKLKIDLVSPWISPEIIEKIFRVFREKHLKIRILTKADLNNEIQTKSIEKLVQLSRDYSPNFQAKIINDLHAKGMLVDNVVLLHGSFNFTLTGMCANIENVIIDFNLQGISEFKKRFDELWEEASSLI